MMKSIGTELLSLTGYTEAVFHHACQRNENVCVSGYLEGPNPLERVVAALMLVPILPVIGVLVVLIRLTSNGPAIFKQRRVGLNGVPYTMYKLRTMRCDAEAATGPIWATEGDPRTTRLGAALRRMHLDELPQLFNVLKGEMRFVGPRPERPEFVSVLEKEVPGYCERLRALPGITGLAQVNLPPDTNTASVQRKVRLDVEYIRTANLQLDLQIIACTLLKTVLVPSHWRVRMTGVDRSECLRDVHGIPAAIELTPRELVKHHNNGKHHKLAHSPNTQG